MKRVLISSAVGVGVLVLIWFAKSSQTPATSTEQAEESFGPNFELLRGKPFGEKGVVAFLERQKERHALLLADLKNTDEIPLLRDHRKIELMTLSLRMREIEVSSMLRQLDSYSGWTTEDKGTVRAVLQDELAWVTGSIEGLNSVR